MPAQNRNAVNHHQLTKDSFGVLLDSGRKMRHITTVKNNESNLESVQTLGSGIAYLQRRLRLHCAFTIPDHLVLR